MSAESGGDLAGPGVSGDDRAEETGAAVLAWAQHLQLVTDTFEEQRLVAMRLGEFAALIVPEASVCDLELTARWAAFICLVDDRFDRGGLGSRPDEVGALFSRLLDVMDQGHATGSDSGIEAALDDLWRRTAPRMSMQWRDRFLADYRDFALATREEATSHRDRIRLRLRDYVLRRRRTITALPMADILECTTGAPWPGLPEARMRALRLAAADVAGWTNDLVSAEDDLLEGRDNLVTVLGRERRCSLSSAREQVTRMRDRRLQDFHALAASLTAEAAPGTEREMVRRYVAGLESFVAATLHWLGVTGRFDAHWLPQRTGVCD
ncbi:terpene synthase family protein [Streptomyces mirabilis]|uniref:terpene synthase family protein n=1 Tax=Streptomyces mirabilis TaxID=68239 RepID=UPI0036E14F24